MDRLARNLDDLRRLVQTLTKRGVRIEFTKETLTFTGEERALKGRGSSGLSTEPRIPPAEGAPRSLFNTLVRVWSRASIKKSGVLRNSWILCAGSGVDPDRAPHTLRLPARRGG